MQSKIVTERVGATSGEVYVAQRIKNHLVGHIDFFLETTKKSVLVFIKSESFKRDTMIVKRFHHDREQKKHLFGHNDFLGTNCCCGRDVSDEMQELFTS